MGNGDRDGESEWDMAIEMEKVNSLLFNLCRQEDMEHMDII